MSVRDKFAFNYREEDRLVRELKYNPYYQVISSGAGSSVEIDSREYLNLASNNYLGFSRNPEILARMKQTIDQYGASMCGTPVACGNVDLYAETAVAFSRFLGLEDTIIFPSCYQANAGIIGTLAKPGDIILVDRSSHASLLDGIRAAKCKVRPFKHNDVDHLLRLIKRTDGYDNIFVITESVFSTEGSIAPFDKIYRICQEFDAIPIVDDSHGIGVIGKNGGGILEEKGIENYEGIYTASTGKALGLAGGIVSSVSEVIMYLKYNSASLLYSTALPPVFLSATTKALEILSATGAELMQKLRANKAFLTSQLTELGYRTTEAEAPICSVIVGSNEKTFLMSKLLFEQSILTTPFIFPSVARDKGVIRMIPRVDLTQQQLECVIEAFRKIKAERPELFEQ
ncbi:MAG: aminotransferase class I/II-fold pyridoxal phosphate-dependent enzyme [Candidatus Cloacimonetes bacterium]|nr:aminotransferase class I/II-fold pyridoxal phosphate-dependent enzyme [Candidatus Cloacimonadota bacterium]